MHPVPWLDFITVMKMGRGSMHLCNENFPSVYFNNISFFYDYQKSISIFSADIYGILRLCAREGEGVRF